MENYILDIWLFSVLIIFALFRFVNMHTVDDGDDYYFDFTKKFTIRVKDEAPTIENIIKSNIIDIFKYNKRKINNFKFVVKKNKNILYTKEYTFSEIMNIFIKTLEG